MADPSRLVAPGGSLAKRLDYRRFVDDTLRILLLDGNYLLVDDCDRALRRGGHRVLRVPVGEDLAALVKQVLWAAVESKPDFVLAINHIGFDEGGALGHLLQELGLPVAVWYVDSPGFVLAGATPPCPEYSSVFCWERAWMETLTDAGFDDVSYLPLATDPTVFRPTGATVRYPLSFVGASMQHARKKWRKRVPQSAHGDARKLARAMLQGERQLPDAHLARFAPRLTGKRREDFLALATWSATGLYRTELLRAVSAETLHLFGDPGWQQLLPQAHFEGPVTYGEALAAVYGGSALSLNATSLQMPTAVNQRVFDVPASGGFVLTDHQRDLEELFEPGFDIVTYRNSDELAEQCERYSEDQEARERIATRGRERVLAEHTYDHRIGSIIEHLRARHTHRAHAIGSP